MPMEILDIPKKSTTGHRINCSAGEDSVLAECGERWTSLDMDGALGMYKLSGSTDLAVETYVDGRENVFFNIVSQR